MAGPRRDLPPHSEEELAAATVGPLVPRDGPIELAAPDPRWPRQYEAEAARVRAALAVHHVGSTSVPGLSAKPIIDTVLVVSASGEAAGPMRKR